MKVAIFFIPLLVVALANFITDAAQYLHRPFILKDIYTDNFSQQSVGIAHTMSGESDSLLIGSSTSGNILYEDLASFGMKKTQKLVSYGMTLREGYELLKVSFKDGKQIKKVFWVLDDYALEDNFHPVRPLNRDMLEKGVTSIFHYLLSRDTLETSLVKLGVSKRYQRFKGLEYSAYTGEGDSNPKERWRKFILNSEQEKGFVIHQEYAENNRELYELPELKLIQELSNFIKSHPECQFVFMMNPKPMLAYFFHFKGNVTQVFNSSILRFYKGLEGPSNFHFYYPVLDNEFYDLEFYLDSYHPKHKLMKLVLERIASGRYEIKSVNELRAIHLKIVEDDVRKVNLRELHDHL